MNYRITLADSVDALGMPRTRMAWRLSESDRESLMANIATLAAANPQPQTELVYTNVFELLAAVLLSAQATDVSVNKATRALFARANTPQQMLALGVHIHDVLGFDMEHVAFAIRTAQGIGIGAGIDEQAPPGHEGVE